MILGDKIAALRKQNGWSQEELAGKLEISRQSVSKWESGASIPDLDKILKLSSLFGVSTDYLLKDDMEEIAYTQKDETPEEYKKAREVSLQEAMEFLETEQRTVKKRVAAMCACILSPVCLIFLGGVAEYKNTISENMAGGIGVTVLLIILAAAVAVLILTGAKLEKYEYLEKEAISLQYGVKGIVEKRKEEREAAYRRSTAAGVAMFITGVVPLMLAAAFELSEFVCVCCVCLLLVMIAAGVFIISKEGIIQESYNKLLQLGEYAEEEKELRRKTSFFPAAYWCLATAVYLGISFWKNDWGRSWIVWPVAGVLFAALYGIVKAVARSKK